jgi:hypothetical protein
VAFPFGALVLERPIENVMVTHSKDDGFQFVGGTVNVSHLISYNNGDDDYDFDYGYQGNMQFLIAYRTGTYLYPRL